MKKKNYLTKKMFMLASCMAIMLAIITVPKAMAQDTLYIPPTPGTVNAIYWPIVCWATDDVIFELITAADIIAAGGQSGMITALAVQWNVASNTTTWPNNTNGQLPRVNVHLANVTSAMTTLPIWSQFMPTIPSYDWQSVYSRVHWSPALVRQEQGLSGSVYNNGDWMWIIFDTPFEYTGGAILFRWHLGNFANGGNSSTQDGSSCPYRRGTSVSGSRVLSGYGWSADMTNPNLAYTYSGSFEFSTKSNFRFTIEMADHDTIQNAYNRASVSRSQVPNNRVKPGDMNVPIVNLSIRMDGNLPLPPAPPGHHINHIRFSGNGSIGKISRAKLYYTGAGRDFNTATLLSTIDFTTGATNNDTFNFTFPQISLGAAGSYNFWLAYDVSGNCPQGVNMLAGRYQSMSIFPAEGSSPIPIIPAVTTPNPWGTEGIEVMTDIIIGEGTSTATDNPVGLQNWGNGAGEYLLTAQEIAAAGGEPGDLSRIGLWFTTLNNFGVTGSLTIRVMEVPANIMVFPAHSQMTQVFSRPNFQWSMVGAAVNTWTMIHLDQPFEYKGGNLFIHFCHTTGSNNRMPSGVHTAVRGRTLPSSPVRTRRHHGNGAMVCGSMPNIVNQTFMPNFRLTIETGPKNRFVYPGDLNTLSKGFIYNNDILATPRFSFDLAHLNPVHIVRARYRIVGPEPINNIVYEMVDPLAPANRYMDFVAGNGDVNYSVERAIGSIAWTGPESNADNKSLDLRPLTLPTGQYTSVLITEVSQDGGNQFIKPTLDVNRFFIRAANDIAVSNILSPEIFKEYPIGGGINIPITAIFENFGTELSQPFFARARIYKCQYDPTTGITTNLVLYDSTPIVAFNDVLQMGESTILTLGDFYPDTSVGGWYAIEVLAWYQNEALVDQDPSNNVYPRAGFFHVVHAQSDLYPQLTTVIQPTGTEQFTMGRTVDFVIGLQNLGIVDLSVTDNVQLHISIHPMNNGTPITESVYDFTFTVRQAGAGEGEVRVIPRHPNDDVAGWVIDTTGDFRIVIRMTWPGGSETTIFRDIKVRPALNGVYQIGANQPRFRTIKSAIDTLHLLGVTGPVTFQLTDTVYTERSWTEANIGLPALDFRSKIPGVRSVKDGVVRINPIKFVPAPHRAVARGTVRINLQSRTGMGIAFGVTHDGIVAPATAMINEVNDRHKRHYAESDGHIIFDGGPAKSLRFTMDMPQNLAREKTDFRAPFFLANAKNITIQNCIIEDGVNQTRSRQYSLPGNIYQGVNIEWLDDFDIRDGGRNRTYSAGVVMRALPPFQVLVDANTLAIDTVPCHNNVIAGNEITQFSYGVVGIGLNYILGMSPHIINIRDTLLGLTKMDLDMNSALMFVQPTSANPNPRTISTPAFDTTIYFYRVRVAESQRANTFYKLYDIRNNATNTRNSYTVVLDSSQGGLRRYYNHSNLIENNLIYDIGRAGIFMGNEQNSIIRGNYIRGIDGQVIDVNGVRQDENVDCAGIMLGGREHPEMDGFATLEMQVYKNEISNILSQNSASGIKLEQTMVIEQFTNYIAFPDAYERSKIYSNIIHGILAGNANVDRYGIKLSNTKRIDAPANEPFYITADRTKNFERMLIANNTILLAEDNLYSTGDYVGLYLQKIRNSRILNNAVELSDATQAFPLTSPKFAAAVYYQGPEPATVKNEIDYNVYNTRTGANATVDAYRYVNEDISGIVLDAGYRGEYSNLTQWQNWMRTDMFSTTKSFSEFFALSNETFPKYRMITDPLPINNPLEKRGIYLAEAATDIDGISRDVADQRYDIGAQYLEARRFMNDIEILNIYEPATYKANLGPFRDAEYFMIDNKPITVRVLVRNNGNNVITNRNLTLNVYRESATVNNANATAFRNLFDVTHYNNEIELYRDATNYTPIPSSGPTFFTQTKPVTIPPGEGLWVEFKMENVFETYWYLNNYTTANYTVPFQFTTMAPNVTPRYKFDVIADVTGDEDPTNNRFEKYARFYIKKSQKNMLISAYNTYNTINTIVGGQTVPSSRVTNPDFVAGKLNLDTLISGFRQLDMHQAIAGEGEPIYDFDVLDRKSWDYRNIDFTLYNTLFISDELKIDSIRWVKNNYDFVQRNFQDKWFTKNIRDFLTNPKSTVKTNLVIASEEYISDIYTGSREFANRFLAVNPGTGESNIPDHYKSHTFLALNNPAKMNLATNFFRTGIHIDSLNDPRTGRRYFYKTPFYKIEEISVGMPPFDYIALMNVPLTYSGKTTTGRNLAKDELFTIRNTGWNNAVITDAEPFGTVYRPISNAVGFTTVGIVYDELYENNTVNVHNVADSRKAMNMATSTQRNNILLFGFDWRHYQDIEKILRTTWDFLITNGGPIIDETSISLYAFEATPISNRVELAWNTASECNTNRFELERADVSQNKVGTFRTIDRIEASRDNTVDNSYNRTDLNLTFGNTYAYRVKVIDFNGNTSYSDKRIVKIEEAYFTVGEVVPNPVNNSNNSTITVVNEVSQHLHISIFDLSGREVVVLADDVYNSGPHTFTINATNLGSGTYTVMVRSANRTISKSFTVAK